MQNNKNKHRLQSNYTNSESPNSIPHCRFVLHNKHASKLAKISKNYIQLKTNPVPASFIQRRISLSIKQKDKQNNNKSIQVFML